MESYHEGTFFCKENKLRPIFPYVFADMHKEKKKFFYYLSTDLGCFLYILQTYTYYYKKEMTFVCLRVSSIPFWFYV